MRVVQRVMPAMREQCRGLRTDLWCRCSEAEPTGFRDTSENLAVCVDISEGLEENQSACWIVLWMADGRSLTPSQVSQKISD